MAENGFARLTGRPCQIPTSEKSGNRGGEGSNKKRKIQEPKGSKQRAKRGGLYAVRPRDGAEKGIEK